MFAMYWQYSFSVSAHSLILNISVPQNYECPFYLRSYKNVTGHMFLVEVSGSLCYLDVLETSFLIL